VKIDATNGQCPPNRGCGDPASAVLCDDSTKIICCCEEVQPGGYCGSETLFGNNCASSSPSKTCENASIKLLTKSGCDSNRWGWVVQGTAGSTFYLWSGAGKNDLTKGTLVGTATVGPCKSGTGSCVTYKAGSDYAFSEVHVDATCGTSLADPKTRNGGYPCAPGSYRPGPGGTCSASGPSKKVEVPLPPCTTGWTLILHGVVSKFSNPKPSTCSSPC
jgi:hypothetical protein